MNRYYEQPDAEEEFWMILKHGGDVPRKRHSSYAAAQAEAQRLATNHPGEKFYVLHAGEAFQSRQVVRTVLQESVPF